MYFNLPCVTILVILASTALVKAELPTCQMTDFHWEYTECDNKGGRWKVQVPQPDKCTGGAPRPPERGTTCDFTCKPGEYLDVQGDETCKSCPPGTFSLGGGVRFEDWDRLPLGFTSKTEKFERGFYHATTAPVSGGNETTNNSCSNSAWTPNGKVISSLPGRCSATLSYTVSLVKAGEVIFEYQHEDDGVMFHVQISNSKCQSLDDHRSKPSQWPTPTKNGEWGRKTITLKSGPNTISFKTLGLGVSTGSGIVKPIRIKSIDITGIAYTQECTKCRAGTNSSKAGSQQCSECPQNTFSQKGAAFCTNCRSDEYSESSSGKCEKKPSCTDRDYFEYNTQCDQNNQTIKRYRWIWPKNCKDGDEVQGAAKLPEPGKPETCPPCNLGMTLKNSKCEFCPNNQYSDGITGCKTCSQNTAPEYGLSIQWWNNLPQNVNLSSRCLAVNDNGCVAKTGWLLSTDNIHTSKGHSDDAFMVLSIKIGGFKGVAQSVGFDAPVVGNISFVFDLKCASQCTFFFMMQSEEDDDEDIDVIQSWTGSTNKVQYSYAIRDTEPVIFSWAFQKKELKGGLYHNTHLFPDDVATIYSVNVTNTAFGGAVKCTTCPQGTNKEGCIPCPAGHYIDGKSNQCKKCPPGTIVRNQNSWGIESCVKCGEGLTAFTDEATGKSTCITSCKYNELGGNTYDFTKLSQITSAEGTRLFTSSGTHYYHFFNISLCGGSYNFPKVMCADNISDLAFGTRKEAANAGVKKGSVSQVNSIICRSTIIPPKPGEQDVIISAQPASIGDILVNITNNATVLKAQMEQEGFKSPGEDSDDVKDVHFYYRSDSSTAACKFGRTTVITLRCDISAKGSGSIELPPKCSDGTCDGCNFHFLWRTVHACPVCEEQIYKKVVGQCIKGEQEIHRIGPKYCPDSSKVDHQKCSVIPFWLQVSILGMCGVGILLFILIVYCWKHNRKLEYKYMKLVGASEGKDGEMNLPAAETCALSEDEDEQFDAVEFKESKGNKFFSKIKNMGKKGDNPFESIGLSDKEPLTS